MSLVSNQAWAGYQAWAERVGYLPSYDTKGPWLDYTGGAGTQGMVAGIQSKNTGKVYFEFNFFRQISTPETEYFFGVITDSHSTAALPGFSAESWAFCTESVGFYHDSVRTTTTDSIINGITAYGRGWFYSYSNYVHYSQYTVKVAIDFDAGKLWLGVFNGSLDSWNGDPVAGTSPTYAFAPNTALRPAIGWKFIHTGFQCTAVVQLGCSRDFARRAPPTGFSFWDTFDYQKEVLADNPVGYWMAAPHKYGETFVLNSLGYPGLFADSSLNQKYAEHYKANVYQFLTAYSGTIFPTQPPYCWYASLNSRFGKYPVSLGNTTSFTLEASVLITGAGATNGVLDSWTEGSGLACNYIQANQQASFTIASLWTGITYRGRRFKFAVSPGEVTSGSDVLNGAHHIVATWNYSTGTLRLYIDGALSGETTGVISLANGSFYIAWGAIRPNQSNGQFPGYIRDCAYYPVALSAERVAAHYAALTSTDISLSGAGASTASSTGGLSFLAELAAATSALASATGNIAKLVSMSGTARVAVSVTGAFPNMSGELEGAAQAQTTATGDLSTTAISSAAQVVASAAGNLSSLISMAVAAQSDATATGSLDVIASISSAAQVLASASAAFGQAIALSGGGAIDATAQASMGQDTGLLGSSASKVTAAGAMGIAAALEGSAAGEAGTAGNLGMAANLAGTAGAVMSANALPPSQSISLGGAATAQAAASGRLSVDAQEESGITYAVNVATGAVTTLSTFGFNRLVCAHRRLYGIRDGTLYAVGGDTDPDDTTINATIRFAPSHYGAIGRKRLETVYCYSRELAGLLVTPVYDETSSIEYITTPLNRDGMRATRAFVGRGNSWHTLGFEIRNKNGGKLDIGGLEPIISPLSRKRR